MKFDHNTYFQALEIKIFVFLFRLNGLRKKGVPICTARTKRCSGVKRCFIFTSVRKNFFFNQIYGDEVRLGRAIGYELLSHTRNMIQVQLSEAFSAFPCFQTESFRHAQIIRLWKLGEVIKEVHVDLPPLLMFSPGAPSGQGEDVGINYRAKVYRR